MSEKNKKRLITSLVAVLVILAIIGLCLLGTTMARYTSTESADGTVTVAKWTITDNFETSNDSVIVSFDSLSPEMDAYSSSSRSNSTASKEITIKNDGAVDAYVLLNIDENATVTLRDGGDVVENSSSYYYDDGSSVGTYDTGDTYTNYTSSSVSGLFSLEKTVTINTADATSTFTAASVDNTSGGGYNGYYRVASGVTLKITLSVAWNSRDSGSSGDSGSAADELDTFVGRYFEYVSYNIGYTAVQGSETSAS